MRAIRTTAVIGLLASAFSTASAGAQEVSLSHKGIQLVAKQELADGKTWKQGGFLLVHGTMAHGQMELIAAVQKLLREKGHSSLAINLGFNIDRRKGMLDCAVTHTHTNVDAVDEVAAWVGWLKAQGAASIAILGHSRGGNQVARYQVAHGDPAVKRLVLVSPATWNGARVANEYQLRYKKPLDRFVNTAKALVAKGRGDSLIKDVDFLYCPSATVAAKAFASYYVDDKKMDTPSLLSDVKIPVLVTAASADTTVPDIPERMKGRVTKNIGLKIIDGADHFYRDLFAEDLVDAVHAFAGS